MQVSALGLDPAGARLVTGGYDYDIKFWDFAGMDNSLQSFRSMTPCGRYVRYLYMHRSTNIIREFVWIIPNNS